MSWLFRLLDHVLGRFRAAEAAGEDPKWVEPSNAITRAVLSGNICQLLSNSTVAVAPSIDAMVPAPLVPAAESVEPRLEPATEAEEVPARTAAAIVTRTAQRVRRRRATRAA